MSYGAVVGNNSATGGFSNNLPGRQVPYNTMVQTDTIFGAK
jgi:hypothetical protein